MQSVDIVVRPIQASVYPVPLAANYDYAVLAREDSHPALIVTRRERATGLGRTV